MRYIVVVLCTLSLLSCKKKGCMDPAALNYNETAKKDDQSCVYEEQKTSSFTLKHLINSQNVVFDSMLYIHPLGYEFSVQTLRYFISDVVLYRTNGDSVIIRNHHYTDAKSNIGLSIIYNGEIPNDTYTGIGFIFGLKQAYNTTGYFNNPPESLMEWPDPIGGGYHYMKLEGKFDSTGVIKGYAVHTGGLMGQPYCFKVDLVQGFTITDNDVDVVINMNIENWLDQPDLFDFNNYPNGIMVNASAQQIIMNNGWNVFSLGSIQ